MPFAVLLPMAALLVGVPAARAQDAPMEEELPPGLAPDQPRRDYLFEEREVRGPAMPPRVVVSAGVGSSLRIVQDLRYAQDRFAPAFLDLFGAFVFGSRASLRHGVGLGISSNLSGDGASDGVDALGQLVLSPSYVAYLRFGLDLVVMGKVSVGLPVTHAFSPGVELSVGAAYFLTAGLGLYAEVGASTWFGGDLRIHPLLSGELGVMIDYEVLR